MILRDFCMIVDWFDKYDLVWSLVLVFGGLERIVDVYL